jgi:hypothetical protein
MRRPASRPVRPPIGAKPVTRRVSGDSAAVLVRVGDKVLGSVARLGGDEGVQMTGAFTNRPAFTDYVDLFLRLDRAIAAGAPADDIRAEIAAAGIEVWHTVHEMRLDRPGSLTISGGEVRFHPTDAFVMMRTGGL